MIETELKKILRAASGILVFSAAMDFGLWILQGYLVPSWTLATLSLGVAVLLEVLVQLANPGEQYLAMRAICPGFEDCPRRGPRQCSECMKAISRDLRAD